MCGLCLALVSGGALGREWSECAPSTQGRARVSCRHSLLVVGSAVTCVVTAQASGPGPGGWLKYGHACPVHTLWGGRGTIRLSQTTETLAL